MFWMNIQQAAEKCLSTQLRANLVKHTYAASVFSCTLLVVSQIQLFISFGIWLNIEVINIHDYPGFWSLFVVCLCHFYKSTDCIFSTAQHESHFSLLLPRRFFLTNSRVTPVEEQSDNKQWSDTWIKALQFPASTCQDFCNQYMFSHFFVHAHKMPVCM